jgi:hypothetical protein
LLFTGQSWVHDLTNHSQISKTIALSRHPPDLAPGRHSKFSLGLQPIIQIMSVFSAPLLEQLISTKPDVLVISGLCNMGRNTIFVFPVSRFHGDALLS